MTAALQITREELAQELRDAGVTAVTLNPGSIDPPCVLVDRPTFVKLPRAGGCIAVEAEFPVKVIGPANGNNEQLARMLEIVEQILISLRGVSLGDTEPFIRGTAELPAYTLTLTRQVTIHGGS